MRRPRLGMYSSVLKMNDKGEDVGRREEGVSTERGQSGQW